MLRIGDKEILINKAEAVPLSLQLTDFGFIEDGTPTNIISYTIQIPYAVNAATLEYLTDINSVQGLVNRCSLLNAMLETKAICLQGTIKFIRTSIEQGTKNVILEAQFVSGLSDFFRACAERLCDLKIGKQLLNSVSITDTIDKDQPYDGTNPLWFPQMNLGRPIGYHTVGQNELSTSYNSLNPAVHDRAILQSILDSCDLTLCSEFLNSERFARQLKTYGTECKYSQQVVDISLSAPTILTGNLLLSGSQFSNNFRVIQYITLSQSDGALFINGRNTVLFEFCIEAISVLPGTQVCINNIQGETLACQSIVSGLNKFELEIEENGGVFIFVQGQLNTTKFDSLVTIDNQDLRFNAILNVGRSLSCDKSPRDLVMQWTKRYNLVWLYDPFDKCLYVEPKYSNITPDIVECNCTAIGTESAELPVDNLVVANSSFTISANPFFIPQLEELRDFINNCLSAGNVIGIRIQNDNFISNVVIADGIVNLVGNELTVTNMVTSVPCDEVPSHQLLSIQNTQIFYTATCYDKNTTIIEKGSTQKGFYQGQEDWTSKVIKSTIDVSFGIDGLNRTLNFEHCELEGVTDEYSVELADKYPTGETTVSLDCFAPIENAPYTVIMFSTIVTDEDGNETTVWNPATQEQIDAGVDTMAFQVLDENIPTAFEDPAERLCTDKMISLTKIEARTGDWHLRFNEGNGLDSTQPRYGYSEFTETWDRLKEFYQPDIDIYNTGVRIEVDVLIEGTELLDIRKLFQTRKFISDTALGNGYYILEKLDIKDLNASKLTARATLIGTGK